MQHLEITAGGENLKKFIQYKCIVLVFVMRDFSNGVLFLLKNIWWFRKIGLFLQYQKQITMKQTIKLLEQQFQSSSGLTPQFKEFYDTFNKEFTKFLKSKGCYDIEITRGHFYISGFFTMPDHSIYYFNFGDVRILNPGNKDRFYFRTAEHYADYTGGPNQYQNLSKLNNWSIFKK